MKLEKILSRIEILRQQGDIQIDITGINSDSRKIESGNLFVAVCGTVSDGHDYIEKAIAQGASAIVCQTWPQKTASEITYIQVKDSASAWGMIASAWFGYPSEQLILTGVTGTNGKTTVATLLYELFGMAGETVGLLSTVCNYIGKEAVAATHTTPDPLELNGLLRRMVDAGCRHAFMEVSSHSVDQKRIAGLRFKGGIFTNLTRDHLDYHKTVGAYLKAKKGFFDMLPPDAFALTNNDDKNGTVMLQNTAATKQSYSLRGMADFKGRILESHFDGTELEINGRQVFVRFVGRFNAYNLLAVYGAACLLGMDAETALVNMSRLIPVSGRFQTLRSPKGFTAIVDYAHTPDAIKNVLTAVHEVLNSKGQVISVVGAGGNRDKGKRPLMAQETVAQSDKVILTSDNPRFENPEEIIADMLQGLDSAQRQKVLVITDRREAIKAAIMLAQPDDVVVVAGKGHEDYQEIQGIKHHFNDKEEIEALFAQMQ